MPPDHPPQDLVVSGSLPCICCAYDLDRCALDHVCPECGTPVVRSQDSVWLDGPDFIKGLRRGLALLTLASFVGPAVYAVILLWAVALHSPGWDLLPCFVLTSIAGPLVAWIGLHQLIGHPTTKRLWSASLQPYAQFLSAAFATSFIAMVALMSVSVTASSPVSERLLATVALIAGLAWCARNLVILAHVRAVAQVSNMPRLATAVFIFQIAAGVLGLIGGFCGAHYAGVLELPNPVLQVTVTVLGISLLAWLIAWPMLLQTTSSGLKRILTTQSRRGRPTITSAPAPPTHPSADAPSNAPPAS